MGMFRAQGKCRREKGKTHPRKHELCQGVEENTKD